MPLPHGDKSVMQVLLTRGSEGLWELDTDKKARYKADFDNAKEERARDGEIHSSPSLRRPSQKGRLGIPHSR
jgi:hypothetical protein